MSAPREIQLSIPGLELSAQAWGPPDGPRVLALHGWLDNCGTFAGMAPLMPELTLCALDLPGHGRSQHRSANDTYHFIDWVPDVLAAADALGWDRFALMGHSMGGAIGSLVAGTAPQRVERLVLLDGIAPYTGEADETPGHLAQYIEERARAVNKEPPRYPDRAAMIERLRKAAPHLSAAAAHTLVARGAREVPGGVTWSYDARLRRTSPMRFTRAHVEVFLRRVACPALLVRPHAGIEVEPEVLETLIGYFPALRVERLPGSHHVHLEEPAAVAGLVRPFLTGAT